MNLKKCKSIRSFVREQFSNLPQYILQDTKENVRYSVDEKGGVHSFSYTGTIRVSPNSQRGRYLAVKKTLKKIEA